MYGAACALNDFLPRIPPTIWGRDFDLHRCSLMIFNFRPRSTSYVVQISPSGKKRQQFKLDRHGKRQNYFTNDVLHLKKQKRPRLASKSRVVSRASVRSAHGGISRTIDFFTERDEHDEEVHGRTRNRPLRSWRSPGSQLPRRRLKLYTRVLAQSTVLTVQQYSAVVLFSSK